MSMNYSEPYAPNMDVHIVDNQKMDMVAFDMEVFGCPLLEDDNELNSDNGNEDDVAGLQEAVHGLNKRIAVLAPAFQAFLPSAEVPTLPDSYSCSSAPMVPVAVTTVNASKKAPPKYLPSGVATVPGSSTSKGSVVPVVEVIPKEFYHKNKWELRKDLSFPEWKVLTPKQRNTERRKRKMKELEMENDQKKRFLKRMKFILTYTKGEVAILHATLNP